MNFLLTFLLACVNGSNESDTAPTTNDTNTNDTSAPEQITIYKDEDGDTYVCADENDPTKAISKIINKGDAIPEGWTDKLSEVLDCNDDPANGGASVNPGANETPYDGVDQDCNGADLLDADGDGYDAMVRNPNGDDCDDTSANIHPGAIEKYNGKDDNCDGSVESLVSSFQGVAHDTHDYDPLTGPANPAFGDVNGDGQVDQIIGQSDTLRDGYNGEGQITLYFDPSHTTPDVTLSGGIYDMGLGWSLAVGDFDQDGYADIISSLGYMGDGLTTGGVILYYGRDDWSTVPDAEEAELTFNSTTLSDEEKLEWSRDNGIAVITGSKDKPLGLYVQAVGDLDGDGTNEFVSHLMNASLIDRIPQIADTATGRYEGAVYVEDIPSRGVVFTNRSMISEYTSTSGDYNNDGIADLVVAIDEAPTGKGLVNLLYGPLDASINTNDLPPTFTGKNDGDEAGLFLGSGLHVAGQGDSLIIGAPRQEGSGRAYIFTPEVLAGLTADTTLTLDGLALAAGAIVLTGNATDAYIPTGICATGDSNGDGIADLVLGVNLLSGYAGNLLLFDGALLATKEGQEIDVSEYSELALSEAGNSSLGDHIACGGDIDGDGSGEVMAVDSRGTVYSLFGSTP